MSSVTFLFSEIFCYYRDSFPAVKEFFFFIQKIRIFTCLSPSVALNVFMLFSNDEKAFNLSTCEGS